MMYLTLKRQNTYLLLGLLYGLTLAAWSFLLAGAGHGTYVALGLSSAPLGFLGIVPALFGLPLLWACVGNLLARANTPPYRWALLTVAAAHYLGAAVILSRDTFGDWGYLNRVLNAAPLIVFCGLAVYLAGQVILWAAFFWAGRATTSAVGGGGRA
jgi:hypothetical protein